MVMLGILSIPRSNAACKRIFSTVNKTQTEFHSSVSEKTLEPADGEREPEWNLL